MQRVATRSAFLHRAPLLHLALALPAGRPATRLAVGGVGLAWAAALVWPLWDADGTALALVVVFVAIAAAARLRAIGRRQRFLTAYGVAATAIVGAAIAADAVRSIAGVHGGATDVTVVAYAAAVALSGGVLFAGALAAAPTALSERAVALEHAGVRLRDALRDLFGDEQLEIGLVDDAGAPLREDTAGRVATPVTVAGERVGVVLHQPSTLSDGATRSAVFATVALAAQRQRLRAEVGRQADAVEASRRRLLLAEDQERRRLRARLEREPGAALSDVERLVEEARLAVEGDDAVASAVERARAQLAHIRPHLAAPLRGFGVVRAEELAAALERLAANLPVATHVHIERPEDLVGGRVGALVRVLREPRQRRQARECGAGAGDAAPAGGLGAARGRGRRRRRRGRTRVGPPRARRPRRRARRPARAVVARGRGHVCGRRSAGRGRATARRAAARSPTRPSPADRSTR